MILTSTSLRALNTALNARFNSAFAAAPSLYAKIATDVPSTKGSNTYAWLGQTTGFKKWVGDRVIQNLATHDFTIRNVKFENTVGVPRDAIEDDDVGIYSPMIDQLGYDAKRHPDTLVFNLLANGFAGLCYDEQPFFSAAHSRTNAKNANVAVSNIQTGTSTPWFLLDASRPIKPIIFQKRRDYKLTALDKDTDENVFKRDEYLYGSDARVAAGYGLWQLAFGSKAALTADNFNAAFDAMTGLKGDKDVPLAIRPTILVVPTSLRVAANTIVNSEKLADGTNNPNYKIVEVLEVPYL